MIAGIDRSGALEQLIGLVPSVFYKCLNQAERHTRFGLLLVERFDRGGGRAMLVDAEYAEVVAVRA